MMKHNLNEVVIDTLYQNYSFRYHIVFEQLFLYTQQAFLFPYGFILGIYKIIALQVNLKSYFGMLLYLKKNVSFIIWINPIFDNSNRFVLSRLYGNVEIKWKIVEPNMDLQEKP